VFTLNSLVNLRAVNIESADNGNVEIDGVFTINSLGDSYGVFCEMGAGRLNIDGAFTINANDGNAYGVYLDGTVGFDVNISGAFALKGSNGTYGVQIINAPIASANIAISNLQFFAYQSDSGNLISKVSTAQYK
jgi:hypothetical protein